MTPFRRLALAVQKILNATGILEAVERRLMSATPANTPPPIMILGCPRSGTTLLYEILTGNYRTAYPSNIASLLYRSPVLATRIGLRIAGPHTPRYASTYGYVPGLLAPSEAGALMRHWFTQSQPLASTNPARFAAIVASLSQTIGGPLVLKNLYLENVFDLVLAALPTIVVLRLQRDPRFTAQSILGVRREEMGSEAVWWGPKPDGYEQILSESPIRQVAWQIEAIETAIDRLLRRPALTGRAFTGSYEELCSMPGTIMSRFIAFYRDVTGYQIESLKPAPQRFPVSQQVVLPPSQWAELQAAINKANPEG